MAAQSAAVWSGPINGVVILAPDAFAYPQAFEACHEVAKRTTPRYGCGMMLAGVRLGK